MSVSTKKTASAPAQGVPYYTPAQNPLVGTPTKNQDKKIPTLFTPLTIRGVTLNNRFVVSPMCMYSAEDGHLTDFHLVHLGAFALRGAALTFVEATAVQSNGGITPEDSGLWQDSQIAPLRRIVDFIHSQGQKVGIQLGHAGRKGTTLAPWHHKAGKAGEIEGYPTAIEKFGGWPTNATGPTGDLPFTPGYPNPREMRIEEVQQFVKDFAAAAKRAVEAGFDVIEIHGAHGYLLTQFLSPRSNKRTDQYGGSFENRIRLVLEIIEATRAVIPKDMPLFLRVSGTEWMEWSGEESWDVPQTIKLASIVADLGVDLIDVSSGGNSDKQKIEISTTYQADIAGQVRAHLKKEGKKLLVGAVGQVTTTEIANCFVQGSDQDEEPTVEVVSDDDMKQITRADLVLIARQFLKDPNFVLRAAHELGLEIRNAPVQYHRGPAFGAPF